MPHTYHHILKSESSDFTELAEKLRANAQALLAFGSSATTEPEDEPPPAEEKVPPEIRSFHTPGFMATEEKWMIKLLKADMPVR